MIDRFCCGQLRRPPKSEFLSSEFIPGTVSQLNRNLSSRLCQAIAAMGTWALLSDSLICDPQETDSNGSGTMSVEDFCGLSTETISLADVVNPIISNDKYIYIYKYE